LHTVLEKFLKNKVSVSELQSVECSVGDPNDFIRIRIRIRILLFRPIRIRIRLLSAPDPNPNTFGFGFGSYMIFFQKISITKVTGK